jgi:SAM-dependent methyltransferase
MVDLVSGHRARPALWGLLQAARRSRFARRLGRVPRIKAARRRAVGLRLAPVSDVYGFDRGTPIDRRYIEWFLTRFAGARAYAEGSIAGRILEIGGREYAERFGAQGSCIDVLHADAANPEATIVGDLTDEGVIDEGVYDCIICTQTLQVIWDVAAALRTIHRALKPSGALFITVPGISKSCLPDRDYWGDFWRFTSSSMRQLCEEAFPGGKVEVEAYGNVVSATMFLYGFAAEELAPAELSMRDPDFEVIVAVRARKAPVPAGR